MLVCFDSSALVKLLVSEAQSDLVALLWDEADAVAASRLVVPEVAAALAAAERAGGLDGVGLREALSTWERYLPALRLVEVTPGVAGRAADLASRWRSAAPTPCTWPARWPSRTGNRCSPRGTGGCGVPPVRPGCASHP